jgi:transcriptional antiterminator RfaH
MSNSSSADQASWHVVHTKPKQEFRALEQLRNQHHTCFLPILQVEKIRGRKLAMCDEPLFSRYLFIRLNPATGNWASIRSTRGVSSLLAFGGRYATLADCWIEALQNTPSAVYQTLFTPGECVSIAAGPFAGFEGIYQAPDGDARALILIELMSQPQKLLFSMEVLRKAA